MPPCNLESFVQIRILNDILSKFEVKSPKLDPQRISNFAFQFIFLIKLYLFFAKPKKNFDFDKIDTP